MANHVARSQPTGAAAKTALAKESEVHRPNPPEKPRLTGYGLPCSKCHLYYSADLEVCPTCKHKERVSPVALRISAKQVKKAEEPVRDGAALEHEREEFLRQFAPQTPETQSEVTSAPTSVCKFGERHPGDSGAAEVCTSCYERLQERLDICEAALHIDLKEAAQIVYDAVWADTSNAGKTYQNAASALLAELRKRAGISTVLGSFQPLEH